MGDPRLLTRIGDTLGHVGGNIEDTLSNFFNSIFNPAGQQRLMLLSDQVTVLEFQVLEQTIHTRSRHCLAPVACLVRAALAHWEGSGTYSPGASGTPRIH